MITNQDLSYPLADQFKFVRGIKNAVNAERSDLIEKILVRLHIDQSDAGHIVQAAARRVQSPTVAQGIGFIAIAENHTAFFKGLTIQLFTRTGAVRCTAGKRFDMTGEQPIVEGVRAKNVKFRVLHVWHFSIRNKYMGKEFSKLK